MSDEKQLVPPPLPREQAPLATVAPRRWRFSLRSLLIATTAIALLLGLLIVLPTMARGLLLGGAWLVMTSWTIVGIIYARGDKRAFCIGTAVVVASMWTGLGGQFMNSAEGLAFFIAELTSTSGGFAEMRFMLKQFILLVIAALNGLLCVKARRFFEDA